MNDVTFTFTEQERDLFDELAAKLGLTPQQALHKYSNDPQPVRYDGTPGDKLQELVYTALLRTMNTN